MIPNARSLLFRYLLEEATDEEKLEVEIRSSADNVYRERLQAAGQELIVAYVAELLTGAKRERVEKYFFRSEERLEKLRFARLLCEYAKSGDSQSADTRDPRCRYLLGQATDEEKRQIENLLADDDYKRRLEIVECELIAAYVLDSLTEDHRERFERYFLISEERVGKVRLAEVVHEYFGWIEERIAQVEAGARWFDRLQRWLAEPVSLNVSRPIWEPLAVVSAAGVAAVVWVSFFQESAITRGLNSLQAAYAQERPVEARLTDFGYAKYPVGQNANVATSDRHNRDKAFNLILSEAVEERTPAAYHALGKLYLTERDFNEAARCFQLALQNNAGDAKLRNDLAVALMERGKEKSQKADYSAGEDFAEAIEHLRRAVELDSSLLDVQFNIALCHQYQSLWRTAEEDWQSYLEKDSGSPWAEEARKNLEKVSEIIKKSGEDRENIRQDFLDAYRRGDVEQAWRAYKRSRQAAGSFITEGLLNNYLSLALSGKAAEARDSLSALRFIGELELERVEDKFSYDLSTFYKKASTEQLRKISAARALTVTANAHFGQSRLDNAIKSYRRAIELFDQAGDVCESLTARRRLGHCYFRQASPALGSPMLMQGRQECETRGYRWLLGMFLNELANSDTYLTKYSTALDHGLTQVSNAKRIEDDYGVLRGINRVAEIYVLLARREETLRMVQEGLSVAGAINATPGQLIGLYLFASKSYMASGKFVAALDYEKEAFKLSLQINDPWLVSRHHVHMGLAHSKLNQHSEAINLMRQGVEIGQRLQDRKLGAEIMAFSQVHLGDVYREIGDLDSSVKIYGEALRLCSENQVDNQWLGFEAKKGTLLTNMKRGDVAATEEGLKEVTELYEQFRGNIEDENNRNSFFDHEQGVYDIAIDYAFTRQEPRRAFDFSEMSRARSLFDAVKLPGKLLDESLSSIRYPSSIQPLDLGQIQGRLPAKTQLVQYSVLDKRLIMWVVSTADFKSHSVEVSREELENKVSDYLRALASGQNAAQGTDSRAKSSELYSLLIKPVEGLLDKDAEICIIPDKFLNRLPFPALISPDTGKYLIEERVILTSPSANMFLVASDNAKQKENIRVEKLLSVGNPRFDGAAFPNLKDLPWAATQASAISAYYRSAEILLEGNAKKSIVRKAIERSDVAHFATHYIPDERSPMLSVLPLAGEGKPGSRENDGMLQTFEFYNMNLSRLRLVVLSGCQTGIERYYKGEGAIGLARAFQMDGIPLVVASLWPVESYPTKELMIAFHKYRKTGGLSTAQALRQAQIDLLNSSSPELRNPYNWAAYAIIGGHAAF